MFKSHYIQNQKFPSSNPNQRFAKPWDPTSLQDSGGSSGQNKYQQLSHKNQVSEAGPSTLAQSWCSQVADKKDIDTYRLL